MQGCLIMGSALVHDGVTWQDMACSIGIHTILAASMPVLIPRGHALLSAGGAPSIA